MALVADELKRKIGLKVEELRAEIVALEKQQVAFDVVIQAYEPPSSSLESSGRRSAGLPRATHLSSSRSLRYRGSSPKLG